MKDTAFQGRLVSLATCLQTWLLQSDGNEKLLCVPSRLGCVDCTPLRVENTTALHFHTYSNHILATYRRLCARARTRARVHRFLVPSKDKPTISNRPIVCEALFSAQG